MNPYTRAHVFIPDELPEAERMALIRNIRTLYRGEPSGHPSRGRYCISTLGQWQLEIETRLRAGVEYQGRLSIHCFSPEENGHSASAARRMITRRTHHWH